MHDVLTWHHMKVLYTYEGLTYIQFKLCDHFKDAYSQILFADFEKVFAVMSNSYW